MAIEKSLYTTPQGLDEDIVDASPIDIAMESPEMAVNEDGSVDIMLEAGPEPLASDDFNANLADYMDDTELAALSSELIELVDADTDSRREWADTFVKGLEVLGFKYEERTQPWDDACGVYSTVLAEAAIRFQAEAMSETFPAAGPVRTKIIGEVTREREEAAERVKADMNYQITDVMTEYRPEHERMLYSLGLAGSAFKKVYFDPNMGRQTATFVPPEDVIVPYGASTIESAERVTHVMRKTENEIKKLQAARFYRNIELPDPEPFHTDVEEKKAAEGGYDLTDDNRYSVYEIHADLIIPGVDEEFDEGEEVDESDPDSIQIAKPYVVTIERGTGEVLAIRRNWDPDDDELMLKRQHFVHYVYVPGFGFYGLGLIHIIGGYARAGTSLIRQLVDSGSLANLPGGLKARGLRVKGDDTPIGPGEWRDVDVPSGAIRDNIMPLPYKEPSQTLLHLLDKITEEGRRLGAISDMNISDMSANAPVGTTLALLERTLKPMAAVQARVHYSMKQEFKLLRQIISEHAPREYSYDPDRAEPAARQQDYQMVEVIPVSDPNSSTMAQRVVQYQTAMQMAQQYPEIYDMPLLHRQMLEIIGIKNADKIVPTDEDAKPTDPVSENMNALVGTPMKAFIYQDHEAHLAAHTAFMQDPMIMQSIGQNPKANEIMGALQAHIAEHTAFNYRKQMQEKLGAPLPAPNEEMSEEMELQLSRLLSDAGRQLTAQHQLQAQQQQAEEEAKDPQLEIKRGELENERAEVQRKARKDQWDHEVERERLALDKKKMMISAATEGAKINLQQEQSDKKTDLEAAKILLDLANGEGEVVPSKGDK